MESLWKVRGEFDGKFVASSYGLGVDYVSGRGHGLGVDYVSGKGHGLGVYKIISLLL